MRSIRPALTAAVFALSPACGDAPASTPVSAMDPSDGGAPPTSDGGAPPTPDGGTPPRVPPWPGASSFGSARDDQALSVAVHGDGSVVVSGRTEGAIDEETASNGGSDGFVRRYDAAGRCLWTRQIGGPGSDLALGVAFLPDGGAIAVGSTTAGLPGDPADGEPDGFVARFDAMGLEVSARRLELGPANGVAADAQGRAYIVGSVNGGAETGYDGYLVVLDADGAPAWEQRFVSPGFDAATHVALGTGGEVWVVGFAGGALSGSHHAGDNDAFVAKLDKDGALLWTQQFGTAGADATTRIALADGGDVLVVGYTSGELVAGSAAGDNDVMIRRLAPNGDVRWTRQLGTPGSEAAYGVAPAADGGAVVVGRIDDAAFAGETSAGLGDALVLRLDADGSLRWADQLGTAEFDELQAVARRGEELIAVGYSGGVFEGLANAGRYDAIVYPIGDDPRREEP